MLEQKVCRTTPGELKMVAAVLAGEKASRNRKSGVLMAFGLLLLRAMAFQRVQGGVTAPKGFIAGASRGGLKSDGPDVAILLCDLEAQMQNDVTTTAVFTRNRVKAAPLLVSSEHLATEYPGRGSIFGVVVNAGNANCCTGEQGIKDAKKMCVLAAQKLQIDALELLVCSTGIIGHPMPMEKIARGIEGITLERGASVDEEFARAIMTTDTRPKTVAMSAQIDGGTVTVGGAAKGVGMIGPDMGPLSSAPHATLLAFLTTDAKIEPTLLASLWQNVVDRTFNSVTVDGDTSTNDSAMLFASGRSGVTITEANRAEFEQLLSAVCVHLAQEIARDGEGATKLVTVQVTGAAHETDAKRLAMTIANSPLVKTAIFGRDPNWGRIAAATGRAGVYFEPSHLSIALNDVLVFRNGEPISFDASAIQTAMSGPDLLVRVSVGEGRASWTAYTCDFSYDYVKINAEYHT